MTVAPPRQDTCPADWRGDRPPPPELIRLLNAGEQPEPRFDAAQIVRRTESVAARDGVRLATDIWLPPDLPAPVLVTRTPYGRFSDKLQAICLAFARRGYAVVTQDCRGTGESEPAEWDYYVFESEDGPDLVEWIAAQPWADGFVAGFGGSYAGQTQWCMATHPAVSAIAPEVSGLGVARNTARLHMFINAYARSVGKGGGKLAIPLAELEAQMLGETLAGGVFNEPLHAPAPEALLARYPQARDPDPNETERRLWGVYAGLPSRERAVFVRTAFETSCVSIAEVEALPRLFGQRIAHDAHTLPSVDLAELAGSLCAPPLMVTGWYDWGLNDALATWALLQQHASPRVRDGARLLIAPSSHGSAGYHEGGAGHPELQRSFRTETLTGLLAAWFEGRRDGTAPGWPKVIYYLMGANAWRGAEAWPPPGARELALFLGPEGALSQAPPTTGADRYVYDPLDPTPTLGGAILSYVYPPGSVDVSQVQRRPDVLTYTTAPLARDVDVVGSLRLTLHASSSAPDTDFCARLSDVPPDGRAIQIQSGMLRSRHRCDPPALLEPGRAYALEIDMWATAHRFARGHRLRLDIASADFPRFDRNANRGGAPGSPACAEQTIFRNALRPSHLRLSVLDEGLCDGALFQ